MNAISRNSVFNYLVDAGTPRIVKTVTEINNIKSQLATTGKIIHMISCTLGRLLNYLSCGRLCASNVCTLNARLVTLENDQASFIKKISQIGMLVIIGQVGIWGPSPTMLSALILHGLLYT